LERPEDLLYPGDAKREPCSFSISDRKNLGRKKGKDAGSFAGDSSEQIKDFYRDVLRRIRAWRPPASTDRRSNRGRFSGRSNSGDYGRVVWVCGDLGTRTGTHRTCGVRMGSSTFWPIGRYLMGDKGPGSKSSGKKPKGGPKPGDKKKKH